MAATGIAVKFVEGLRLSERERAQLIEQMKKNGLADRRKSPRIIVEGGFSTLLTMEAPGGSTSYFRIYPWDLSRGGIGFFHRAFVYPGTRCVFAGLMADGRGFSIKGEVVRCSHVSGNVHAIGAKLDAEIDPEAFLGAGDGNTPAAGKMAGDWWGKVGENAAVVLKLARDRATPEAIRKAAAALAEQVAKEAPGVASKGGSNKSAA